MIRSFRYGNEVISLFPDNVFNNADLNIFAANSMTLLVGPNGSGKTRILSKLTSMVLDVDDPDSHNIEWTNNETSATTCVIYFTPVPYTHVVSTVSNRYQHLQFGRLNRLQRPDFETAEELSESFGLDAAPALELKADYDDVFSFAVGFIFNTAYSRSSKQVVITDAWLSPLLERFIKNEERKTLLDNEARKAGRSFNESRESTEWDECRREAALINAQFEELLLKNIGEDVFLKLRALRHIWFKSKKNDIRIELIRTFGFTLTTKPRRKQPNAIKLYAQTLEILQSIAVAIGDAELRKRSYKVSRSQWRALSKLALGEMATLSSVGLSSGTFALLEQFASIKNAIRVLRRRPDCRNLLLLIDEGDAFLHWEWQQRYIEYLDQIIENSWKKMFDSVQVILATHSPILMSDFPQDNIHRLQEPDNDKHSTSLSFGAPLDAVVRSTAGAGSLGSFSVRIMQDLVRRIDQGETVDPYRVSMIDDPVIRTHIEKIIESRSRRLFRG